MKLRCRWQLLPAVVGAAWLGYAPSAQAFSFSDNCTTDYSTGQRSCSGGSPGSIGGIIAFVGFVLVVWFICAVIKSFREDRAKEMLKRPSESRTPTPPARPQGNSHHATSQKKPAARTGETSQRRGNAGGRT